MTKKKKNEEIFPIIIIGRSFHFIFSFQDDFHVQTSFNRSELINIFNLQIIKKGKLFGKKKKRRILLPLFFLSFSYLKGNNNFVQK